jgi:hypothetical protein
VSHTAEAILWACLCFNPNGFDVYDPIHEKHYRVEHHYQNWSYITWGIDCKVRGPGEGFDWVVVKYTKNPFAPFVKYPREVTHHNKFGVAVEECE